MKVDGGIGDMRGSGDGGFLSGSGAAAKELEDQGYDGIWTAETSHDPFFPLLLAAEHTEKLELGTGIAVAFGRNPMTLANVGYDLQKYSRAASSSGSAARSSRTSRSASRCRGPSPPPACGS